MASPAIDGAVSAGASATTPRTLALTTTNANDIIYVVTTGNVGPNGAPTASGLTFTQRGTTVNSGSLFTSLWAATASGTFSGNITVNLNSATFNSCWAFGVSGASLVFDPNASIPVTDTTGTPSYSTSDANDLIIAVWTEGATATPGVPSGFTAIAGPNTNFFANAAWQQVSSTQSGTTITLPGSSGFAAIIDAVASAPAGATITLMGQGCW